MYILFNSIEFSGISEFIKNLLISLLFTKVSIKDLSIKKEKLIKIIIIIIVINDNLKDIENISFEEREVT